MRCIVKFSSYKQHSMWRGKGRGGELVHSHVLDATGMYSIMLFLIALSIRCHDCHSIARNSVVATGPGKKHMPHKVGQSKLNRLPARIL